MAWQNFTVPLLWLGCNVDTHLIYRQSVCVLFLWIQIVLPLWNTLYISLRPMYTFCDFASTSTNNIIWVLGNIFINVMNWFGIDVAIQSRIDFFHTQLWFPASSWVCIPQKSLAIAHDFWNHYNDTIMGAMPSQMTNLTIVYSTVYSDADQRKHQSAASLAFVRGIHRGLVNSQHKWPVTWKCLHLMTSSCTNSLGWTLFDTGTHDGFFLSCNHHWFVNIMDVAPTH